MSDSTSQGAPASPPSDAEIRAVAARWLRSSDPATQARGAILYFATHGRALGLDPPVELYMEWTESVGHGDEDEPDFHITTEDTNGEVAPPWEALVDGTFRHWDARIEDATVNLRIPAPTRGEHRVAEGVTIPCVWALGQACQGVSFDAEAQPRKPASVLPRDEVRRARAILDGMEAHAAFLRSLGFLAAIQADDPDVVASWRCIGTQMDWMAELWSLAPVSRVFCGGFVGDEAPHYGLAGLMAPLEIVPLGVV